MFGVSYPLGMPLPHYGYRTCIITGIASIRLTVLATDRRIWVSVISGFQVGSTSIPDVEQLLVGDGEQQHERLEREPEQRQHEQQQQDEQQLRALCQVTMPAFFTPFYLRLVV